MMSKSCGFLTSCLTTRNRMKQLKGPRNSEVTLTREGDFVRSSDENTEEINIFEGEYNRITFEQIYTKEFKCVYKLQLYPFDTQVRREKSCLTPSLTPRLVGGVAFYHLQFCQKIIFDLENLGNGLGHPLGHSLGFLGVLYYEILEILKNVLECVCCFKIISYSNKTNKQHNMSNMCCLSSAVCYPVLSCTDIWWRYSKYSNFAWLNLPTLKLITDGILITTMHSGLSLKTSCYEEKQVHCTKCPS